MNRGSSNSMDKLASLRFYDYPLLSKSMDALWSNFATTFQELGVENVPNRLCRNGHPDDALRSSKLLFGQTCGYPLTHDLKDFVQLVATPEYDTPDNDGPNYRSVILTRKNLDVHDLPALRGMRVAVNSKRSFSGFIALKAAFVEFKSCAPFFDSILETGTHHGSLIALSKGNADVCACDCVSYHLMAKHPPELTENLSIVGYGPWAPGLPFVTHINVQDDVVGLLREGVLSALENPASAEARSSLMIHGASFLKASDYVAIIELVERLDQQNADDLFPVNTQEFREDWDH